VREVDVSQFLQQLTRQTFYHDQIVHLEQLPRRSAKYGKLRSGLHDRLRAALAGQGISRLYSHQAQAIDAVRRGQHVVVVTGKTLCYNLPVLDAILTEPITRALYLYPTKAIVGFVLTSLGLGDPGQGQQIIQPSSTGWQSRQSSRGVRAPTAIRPASFALTVMLSNAR